jgi:hypothetical protein
MQVDEKTFVVNSLPSLVAFIAFVKELLGQWKYVTFTWRIGEDRSLDQNALMHVWCTEYAAFLLTKDKRAVSKPELEGMKRWAKKCYYAEFGYPWMVFAPIHPKTKEEGAIQYTSSKDYKQGEMFQFLTWLQMTAANDGLVLESKGEFNKLQKMAA